MADYKYTQNTTQLQKDVDDVETLVAGGKVNSLGLSAESYSTAEKTKLGALPTNAQLETALDAKQDVIEDLTSIRNKANSAYQKPSSGIPKTDLDASVKDSLDKADSSMQKDTSTGENDIAVFNDEGQVVGAFDVNEVVREGRIKQTTGQSTTDLMSQKAVTDALDAKASKNGTLNQHFAAKSLQVLGRGTDNGLKLYKENGDIPYARIITESDLQSQGIDYVLPTSGITEGTTVKLATHDEVSQLGQEINKINVVSDSAGVYPYTFESGASYYIKNNLMQAVTISHRNTPSGTSEDSLLLSAGAEVIYTVTSNGNYLRFGNACNLDIYKIGGLYDLASAGYKYMGIATTPFNPSINTDSKVFYIISSAGVYGSINVSANGLYILKYDGNWSLDTIAVFDDELSIQSGSPVENRGVSRRIGNIIVNIEHSNSIIDVGDVSIGSVIPSPRTSSSYLGYAIIQATEDDYIVASCNNGSSVRYWAWLDSENKVLACPDANTSEVNKKHIAPQNTAYLLAQFKDSSTIIKFTPKDSIEYKIGEKTDDITNIAEQLNKGLIGNVLTSWQWLDFNFKKDEIYQVTNYGGTVSFSTANVQDVTQLIDRIAQNLNPGETSAPFKITQDAKYLRVGGASYGGRFVLTCLSTIEGRITALENDECEKIHREFPFSPDYVLSRVPQLTGGDKYVQTSNVDDLYDLYDGLLARYPDYIEKIDMSDADQYIPVERPAALEGLPIYMYHFKPIRFNNTNGHGDDANRFPIYINAGTHPGEKFNLFTTYYLMEMICDNWKNDLNAEQLRCLTDIYVVPCNSPYGFEVSGRVNENGVNLNRNYPTDDWEVSGYGTDDYTGPTAGSEYETQLTMYYVNLIKPKVFIDVHTPNMGEPLRDKGTTIVNGAYGKDIGTAVCITTNTILVKENSDYPEIEDWPLYTLKDYGAMGSVGKWVYENGGCMSVCLEGSENNKWHNGVWDSEYNENRTNKLMRENMQFFFNYILRATNAMCKMYYTVKDDERV